MVLKLVIPSEVPLIERFPILEPRTIASYERELATAKVTESHLRLTLAHDRTLLRQKDECIHRQEALNQECHHRLLNNLQMIVSLPSLQSRKETNAEVATRLSVAANRVGAIARLHRHLHSMDGNETVEFKKYLDELCRDHSIMSASEERPGLHIRVEGIEISLPTVTAIPLGLIVNELVTNALKHGDGCITVKLEPHPRRGCALSVRNQGPALPKGFDPAACSGLGMSLVSLFVKQIDGELQVDPRDDSGCTAFAVLFNANTRD